MSATTAGALKAAMEQKSLGLAWFNTFAPLRRTDGQEQKMPYGVITDYISNVPRSHGSGGYKTTTELAQIDIYETEDDRRYGLVRSVERALNGLKLPTAPELVYRVEIQSTVPTPDPDPKVKRTTITVAIRRKY